MKTKKNRNNLTLYTIYYIYKQGIILQMGAGGQKIIKKKLNHHQH